MALIKVNVQESIEKNNIALQQLIDGIVNQVRANGILINRLEDEIITLTAAVEELNKA